MTEKPRRVSISTLCVVVAVVALDFAWWRQITEGRSSILGFPGQALDAPAIPMTSLLAVGWAYVLSNRGRIPRRLVGFLWGGVLGVSLYIAYVWSKPLWPPGLFFKSMAPIYEAQEKWPRLGRLPYYLWFADIVYYVPPQFLVACLVGFLWPKSKTEVTPIVDDEVKPDPTRPTDPSRKFE